MKLESQVVSLNLAKRLKKLGVKQKGVLVWYEVPSQARQKEVCLISDENWDLDEEQIVCSAFTVAELGEMLRPYLQKNIWFSEIREAMDNSTYMRNEANARAKMLIYLLEKKFIAGV